MQLVECVPNFSEGRDHGVIDAIARAITGVAGIQLLDIDPGPDTNRTVVTLVGDRSSVGEAAYRAITRAAELIDMSTHTGAHPRMGATDVCPFIPVAGVSMEECVAIAQEVAERVGDVGIPVYLYEHAAPGGRRSLADARRGEYEGLASRTDRPDFGPDLNPTAGATAIGAREFLIAYNVNLNTTDRRLAHQVAQTIRELGVPKRDDEGRVVRDDMGDTVYVAGRFRECKAVGWYLEDYGRAQVSINLTDYNVTSIHDVFEACCEEAAVRGMRVTGSELIGLAPKTALLAAGDHFLSKQGHTTGVSEAARLRSAVLSLGLDELAPFDPGDKIIEYRVGSGPGKLATLSTTQLLGELSSDSPAPGGGSVAAVCGALAAALTSMVAALSYAKKGWEDTRPEMETLGRAAQQLIDWFLLAVDRDAEAYNEVIAATRLPNKTPDERKARIKSLGMANYRATLVPLEVLEHSVTALDLARQAAGSGNPNSVSDAGVSAVCAEAAARAASLNVRINLAGLGEGERADVRRRHDAALTEVSRLAAATSRVVDGILDG